MNPSSVLFGPASTPEYTPPVDPYVTAAGVLKVDLVAGTFVWDFLTTANHAKKFFTTAAADQPTQTIVVSYPTITDVVTFIAVPDNQLASFGVEMGVAAGTSSAAISVYQNAKMSGVFQTDGGGNTVYVGTGNGTYDAVTGRYAISGFPYTQVTLDFFAFTAQYSGADNLYARPVYDMAGVPPGFDFVFYLIDPLTGLPRTGIPPNFDSVYVSGPVFPTIINVSQYPPSGSRAESIFTGQANIWLYAVFKV